MDLLRQAGYKYILGARIKKEPADVVEWMLAQEKVSGTYHEYVRKNGERLIIGYSEQRAKKDAHNREKGIERLRKAYSSGVLTKASINKRGYNKFLTISKDVQVVINEQEIETDNTLEWLKQQRDIYTITQENLGSAGGFHTGMKYVAEHGFKYCWVMDDDVICTETALEELIVGIQLKENIGFVCSKVVGIDGCPMNVPTIDTQLQSNGYPDFMDLIEHGMLRISTATIVSVLIPVKVICEVGLPYKEYFIWGDDTEYTERVSASYPCYVTGKSKVTHKRIIQKGLDFCEETNPLRIQMYLYKIRNSGHRLLLKGESRKRYYYDNLKNATRLLLTGKFLHCKITIKALVSSITFHPQKDYPQV